MGGIVLVGCLVIAAVTCEPNSGGDPESTANPSAEQAEDDVPGGGAGEDAVAALPGEERAGERRPESPGPKGPGIVALAGLEGYLEPCGCTADVMLGGAERIVGYVQAARELYTGSLMLDAGDTFFEERDIKSHLVPQEKARVEVVAAMHRAMGTRAMVPGERDFALGPELYRQQVEAAGAELLGANLEVGREDLEATVVEEVGDWRIGVVGAVQPDLFEGIEGVSATDPGPAVEKALEVLEDEEVDATVLMHHGDLKSTKELVENHAAIDFAVVGHDPREPGGVDAVADGFTLEAYDQGRYVGVLKLFGAGRGEPFENARPGNETDLEKIDEKIAHVEKSLENVPPVGPGEEEPPIRKRLRERLERLEEKRGDIEEGDLKIPEDGRAFLYRSVPMKPGYPVARDIREKRVAYNRRLEELTKQVDRSIPEVEDGEPTYVGTDECKTCHTEAHGFWTGTSHAGAIDTLKERDKGWDEGCVKCHSVGYGEPGGSVVGKLQYEAEVDGETVHKDLRDVGCESCHGPGSAHRSAPVGEDGAPRAIDSGADPAVCKECHVPEHSPRFNYETYVREITGDGHELRSKP